MPIQIIKLNRVRYYAIIAKEISVCLFFILASFGLLSLYYYSKTNITTIDDTFTGLKKLSVNGNAAMVKLDSASGHLDELTGRINKTVTEEELKNMINYFYVSVDNGVIVAQGYKNVSDNLSILLKASKDDLHNMVDSLIKTNDEIRNNNLPALTQTTKDLGTTLITTNKLIDNSKDELPLLFSASREAIQSTNKVINNFDTTITEFNKRYPLTHDLINNNLSNVSGITFQTNLAFERFNKPLTARQKITSFFTEALIKSAPVLLRR